ncbi:hypothetical protein [Brucella grignonensis]|uniref:Uncharacterized protein n=1 Tax=Brucella grignonensis TaxID=94627 RepID=A0A256FRX1_9HYPH|nr:hypothetical protein [Brucella grignonensis]OYR17456.1 hypothetical protein CEV33_3913 [Brucella grignonensis]
MARYDTPAPQGRITADEDKEEIAKLKRIVADLPLDEGLFQDVQS